MGAAAQAEELKMGSERGAGKVAERNPRLFFVSTSSFTSTLSTLSTCLVTTSAGASACSKRRKRMIVDSDIEQSEYSEPELEPSQGEAAVPHRDGRFLLYWLTTTVHPPPPTPTSTPTEHLPKTH